MLQNTTSIEWSGPPSSSSFNTRYFYVTPLYNSGTWKRVTTITYIGTGQKPTVTTDTGTFKEISKIIVASKFKSICAFSGKEW